MEKKTNSEVLKKQCQAPKNMTKNISGKYFEKMVDLEIVIQ